MLLTCLMNLGLRTPWMNECWINAPYLSLMKLGLRTPWMNECWINAPYLSLGLLHGRRGHLFDWSDVDEDHLHFVDGQQPAHT